MFWIILVYALCFKMYGPKSNSNAKTVACKKHFLFIWYGIVEVLSAKSCDDCRPRFCWVSSALRKPFQTEGIMTLRYALIKHRKNCECCPVSLLIVTSQRLSEFRFAIVRNVISVLNVPSLQDCLLNYQNFKKKIVKNCHDCQNISKNQNC